MRFILFFTLLTLLFSCKNEKAATPATPAPAPLSGPYITADEMRAKAEKPDITITVAGAQPGKAYLVGVYQEQNYRADSAQVDASGTARFKNAEAYRPGFFYVLYPNNISFQAIINLDQTFSLTTNTANPIGSMTTAGNVENDLLYSTLKWEEVLKQKTSAVTQQLATVHPSSPQHEQLKQQQYQLLDERKAYLDAVFTKNPDAFFTKFKRAGQNPDLRDINKPDGTLDTARFAWLYRQQFWQGVDFNDERLLYTPVIANKLKRYINELTPQMPDSINASASLLVDQTLGKKEFFKYFANWVVLQYDPKKSTLMDAQAVYVYMIQKYFKKELAFWSDSVEVHGLQLRAYEMAASLIGKKGPDVISKDPAGQNRSIYEMKAPYIVVYMYNPECEHCAIETPKLVQFYKTWKSKGVEVFGIAVDTDDAKWKAYIAKNGLSWTNVHDPSNKSIYAKYFVDVTPEVYVLNPDRIIIGKNLQVDQISTVIERDMRKRQK